MAHRILPCLLVLVLLGALRAQEPAGDPLAPAAPVTVLLVRHAETVPGHDADRVLSPEGAERAAALARLVGEAGVTHLFCSEYPRTRQTLAPLAQRSGLEVTEVSARDGARQVVELKDLPPGSVAVVAGHSNTVPSLVMGLGGEAASPNLPDDAFDRLFLVTLPRVPGAAVSTIELRYGGE